MYREIEVVVRDQIERGLSCQRVEQEALGIRR
jgi:hypothetical protein